MTRRPPREPLIAVIGATGTGKSQLAVEIAKRFNGEVINGDAMQLYKGLPIITNKATAEEQQGIPHHLLGCIGLQEQTWVVGTFVKKALKTIEEIRKRGKLPILVGGTHYYTQSLLFHDRLADGNDHSKEDEKLEDDRKAWPLLEEPTEVLYEELQKVDPVMAERWHPKDRRKIQRSLEIYLSTGRKASDVYAEQRQRKATSCEDGQDFLRDGALSAPSMRLSALIFWIHAETEALRERLDKRVDRMLDSGLLDEVYLLNKHAEAETTAGQPPDETRGIWVSIGYKEFKDYSKTLASGDSRTSDLEKLKAEATERTKIATRQYAKRQIRWIRIKLLNSLSEAHVSESLYLLDGSEVSKFSTNVVELALNLTKDFLQAAPMPEPASLSSTAVELLKPKREYDLSATPEKWNKQQCDVCNVTCVIPEQWQQHIGSKAHKKLASKRRQQQATREALDTTRATHNG